MAEYGNKDKALSPYLKIWIEGKNDMVIAAIGEGTSKEITANWQSPFEDDSLAASYSKIEGAMQIGGNTAVETVRNFFAENTGLVAPVNYTGETGFTSLTTLNSIQVWNGNQPYTFNLSLVLYALTDPKIEVEGAIQALESMMAPNLIYAAPGGRIPESVSVNIGRRRMFSDCVITNMSQPLDKERTKDGYLIRCQVDLQVQAKAIINKPDLAKTYI